MKKPVKETHAKGAPDLSPLYKVEEKAAPAPAAIKEEAPTKIVVHIKAAEEKSDELPPKTTPTKHIKSKKAVAKPKAVKKENLESDSALFEKLNIKTPVFSSRSLSSSTIIDDDDFAGSVVDYESKVAT